MGVRNLIIPKFNFNIVDGKLEDSDVGVKLEQFLYEMIDQVEIESLGNGKFIWLEPSVHAYSNGGSNAAATWTDLDLSASVTTKTRFVILNLWAKNAATAADSFCVRKNGSTRLWSFTPHITTQVANIYMVSGNLIVACDEKQIIEWYASRANMSDLGIVLLGYIEQV